MVMLGPGPLLGLAPVVPRTIYDRGGEAVNVGDPRFGVRFDGIRVMDAAMDSVVNPTQVTSPSFALTAADVGKGISVAGSGAAGADQLGTILSISSPTVAVVDFACLTTVAGAVAMYGTKTAVAIQAAYTYAGTHGGHVVWPPNLVYYLETSVVIPSGVHESDWNWCTCLKGFSSATAFNTIGHNHQRLLAHRWRVYGLKRNAQSGNDVFFYSPGATQATNADQTDIWCYDGEAYDLQNGAVIIGFCDGPQIVNVRSFTCNNGVLVNNSKNVVIAWPVMVGTNLTSGNIAGVCLTCTSASVLANQHNENVTIISPVCKDVPVAEAILIHDANHFMVIAPQAINVAAGVNIGPAPPIDANVELCKFGTVIAPHYEGTTSSTSGVNALAPIEIAGDNRGAADSVVNDITVIGGDSVGWNHTAADVTQGWFRTTGDIRDVSIIGHRASAGYGNGVAIGTTHGPITRLTFSECITAGMLNGPGGQNNGVCITDGTAALTDIHFNSNHWENLTIGVYIATADCSAAGWIDGDTFKGITTPTSLNGGAKMFPARGAVIGDLYSPAGTPTVAIGAALGSGGAPSAIIVGNDYAGIVTYVSGTTGLAAGALGTITFGHTFARAPLAVIISPMTTGAAKYVCYTNTPGTGSFGIFCRVAPDASASISFAYQIIGQV